MRCCAHARGLLLVALVAMAALMAPAAHATSEPQGGNNAAPSDGPNGSLAHVSMQPNTAWESGQGAFMQRATAMEVNTNAATTLFSQLYKCCDSSDTGACEGAISTSNRLSLLDVDVSRPLAVAAGPRSLEYVLDPQRESLASRYAPQASNAASAGQAARTNNGNHYNRFFFTFAHTKLARMIGPLGEARCKAPLWTFVSKAVFDNWLGKCRNDDVEMRRDVFLFMRAGALVNKAPLNVESPTTEQKAWPFLGYGYKHGEYAWSQDAPGFDTMHDNCITGMHVFLNNHVNNSSERLAYSCDSGKQAMQAYGEWEPMTLDCNMLDW